MLPFCCCFVSCQIIIKWNVLKCCHFQFSKVVNKLIWCLRHVWIKNNDIISTIILSRRLTWQTSWITTCQKLKQFYYTKDINVLDYTNYNDYTIMITLTSLIILTNYYQKCLISNCGSSVNLLQSGVAFLYPLKTSENLVFWLSYNGLKLHALLNMQPSKVFYKSCS